MGLIDADVDTYNMAKRGRKKGGINKFPLRYRDEAFREIRRESMRIKQMSIDYSKYVKGSTRPFHREAVIKAIPGSHGNMSRIARRARVRRPTLRRQLAKVENQDIVQMIEEECSRIVDKAEDVIDDTLKQRDDLKVAAHTAMWVLEKHPEGKARGYKNSKEITLEGGVNPIQIQSPTSVPIDALNLPIEIRRQILEAYEAAREKEKVPRLTIHTRRIIH